MADFSRLPGPNADLWDWQLLAACRGVDSSLFFHPEGERGAARSARENSAKEVCMRCPVRSQCAAHALAVREPYGVWGGLTEDEREELMGRARHRVIGAPNRPAPVPAHAESVQDVSAPHRSDVTAHPDDASRPEQPTAYPEAPYDWDAAPHPEQTDYRPDVATYPESSPLRPAPAGYPPHTYPTHEPTRQGPALDRSHPPDD